MCAVACPQPRDPGVYIILHHFASFCIILYHFISWYIILSQEHESALFLSLFKQGIEYLPGGIESGFTHVEDAAVFKTRLLHLKGSHRIRAKQVAPAASSMNSGDVFLLDTGALIYQWNGKESSRKEKAAALEMSTKIKAERTGSGCTIVLCEEGAEVFAQLSLSLSLSLTHTS